MRKDALDDGNDLKQIARVLLGPILRHKPPSFGVKPWLETSFMTETCTIKKYMVVGKFRIPGVIHLTANVKRQGMGHRLVRKGAVLFVREDQKGNPGFVDVEVTGRGRAAQWFSMDMYDWGKIQAFVKLYKRSDQTLRRM